MPDDAPPAFRLEKLGHRYNRGQGAREAVALADMTADIPGGETTVVFGPSGSGKSTLLSLLGLLWDDDKGPEGQLHYGGRDLLRLPADEKAALRAAAFGFVLQSSYLLPHFTNLQNAAMPLAFQGWPAPVRERWCREILEAKQANDGDWSRDLRDKADRFPRAVSLGQRQRYGVLRAVVADPAVVFADEPSSNLDAGNAAATFDLLRRWKAGRLFGEARRRLRRRPIQPEGGAGLVPGRRGRPAADAGDRLPRHPRHPPRRGRRPLPPSQREAHQGGLFRPGPVEPVRRHGRAGRRPAGRCGREGPVTKLRLPLLARMRFAAWFCVRDLFESVALPVSAAVIAAVALSTTASCLALALPGVTAEIRLRRLAEEPWKRCVWTTYRTREEKFFDPRLAQIGLEGAVRERMADIDRGAVVSGFHEVREDKEFYALGGGGMLFRPRPDGRPERPLLPRLPQLLRPGSDAGFDGPEGAGVILSPTLVKLVGGSPDDPPREVRVRLPRTARPYKWKVVGVTRDPLPLEYDFLVTEAEDTRLRAADTPDPQTEVWSGRIGVGPPGKSWPDDWSNFPKTLQDRAEVQGHPVLEGRPGRRSPRLGSPHRGSARPGWRVGLAPVGRRRSRHGAGGGNTCLPSTT